MLALLGIWLHLRISGLTFTQTKKRGRGVGGEYEVCTSLARLKESVSHNYESQKSKIGATIILHSSLEEEKHAYTVAS